MNKTCKRALGLALVIMMIITMAPELAFAAVKPRSAKLSHTNVTLDLANNRTITLAADVLPSGAPQRVVWATGNKAIATINSNGVLTAKKIGTTTVGARPYKGKTWKKIKVTVKDSERPSSMTVPATKVTLGIGDTYTIVPTYAPSGSATSTKFTSSKTAIATVTSKGEIKAKKAGTTRITVRSTRNTSLVRYVTVTVSLPKMPTSVIMTPDTKDMTVGGTLQLSAKTMPEDASDAITWKTSNTAVATVSNDGLVTAKKIGIVQISAISAAKTSVKMVRKITVTDPNKPTAISFDASYQDGLYFVDGNSDVLKYGVSPSTARKDATFSSSNNNIVAVDANGRITCNDTGIVTITVTATGTTLKDTVKVTVYNSKLTTTIPLRTTKEVSQTIKENLAKIDSIKESTFAELESMKKSNTISSAEYTARKEAVNNAFANYAIAWKTSTTVTYWNKSLKDNYFQPNVVYYGMPYIQCGANYNYTNRQFNIAKAVTQKYMELAGGTSRFYKMTSKRLNNFYVGCDCSSLCSMAVWGLNHGASYLNTTLIAQSSYYRTISDKTAMKPGDLLNRSGSHVLMFLYYTNPKTKNQMMIIENGGNVVSCSIKNSAQIAGYTVRRPLKY